MRMFSKGVRLAVVVGLLATGAACGGGSGSGGGDGKVQLTLLERPEMRRPL